MPPAIESAVIGGIVGIVVGVIVSIVGAVVGTRLNRTSEHQRWLREERLSVYAKLLAIAARINIEDHFTKNITKDFIQDTLNDMYAEGHRGLLITDIAADEIRAITRAATRRLETSATKDDTRREEAADETVEAMKRLQIKARKELKTGAIDQGPAIEPSPQSD